MFFCPPGQTESHWLIQSEDPIPVFPDPRWELARFHSLKTKLPACEHQGPPAAPSLQTQSQASLPSCPSPPPASGLMQKQREVSMDGTCLKWVHHPPSIFCRCFNTEKLVVGGWRSREVQRMVQGSCGCQSPEYNSLCYSETAAEGHSGQLLTFWLLDKGSWRCLSIPSPCFLRFAMTSQDTSSMLTAEALPWTAKMNIAKARAWFVLNPVARVAL